MKELDKTEAKRLEEVWRELLDKTGNLISSYGILFFTKEKLQEMWAFAYQMFDRIYGKSKPYERRNKAREIMSEIHESLGDAQLNLGFALKLLKTNKVTPGLRKKRLNDIVMLDGGVFDALFWMFTNNAWEGIYRIWARLEVFLLFFVYDLDVHDPKEFQTAKKRRILYYGQIIDDIRKNKSILTKVPAFKKLRKAEKFHAHVKEIRDRLSHRKSSLLSRFELKNVFYSDLKNLQGKDIWFATSYFPSPKTEIRRIVTAYKNAHRTIDAAGAFLKENYTGRIIR